jgi:hypothetical protein
MSRWYLRGKQVFAAASSALTPDPVSDLGPLLKGQCFAQSRICGSGSTTATELFAANKEYPDVYARLEPSNFFC